MPVLSTFYGIIVRIYYKDVNQHNAPHIHAEYAEHNAVYRIPDGETLVGSLPRNKHRMMQAWIAIHEDELMASWKLAVQGQIVERIPPLH